MTEWRSVAGYEGLYRVSRCGLVESSRLGRPLKPGLACMRNGRGGYPTVGLCRDGVPVSRYVHHLVAEAFIGPRPDGLEINHKSGDKEDNSAGNLEYVTRGDNARHAYALGLMVSASPRGEKHGGSLLRESDVRKIRELSRGGVTHAEIAPMFGVSKSAVSAVASGQNWSHVK